MSSIKSISIILSIVSKGDLNKKKCKHFSHFWPLQTYLDVSALVFVVDMLLVCCLVRDRDSVVNQGASSSRELTLLMVSKGSPAIIGRGGTERPICNIGQSYKSLENDEFKLPWSSSALKSWLCGGQSHGG